ncbi:muscle M-line assembly protein unc-89 isoform X3 [Gasterosteus aculeatus]
MTGSNLENGNLQFFFLFRVLRMPMKMAAVFTVSLLLLCCSAISSTDSSQQCDYYVATGGKATLPMTFALDQSDKLTWMHNMKTILRQTKDKFTSEGKNIVTANGSLTWANVAQSNAGAYKAEVHGRDGKSRWTSKPTRLCVIDPVPKPTVTHECKQTEVKFTCKVQPKQAEGFDFEWLQNNEVLDKEKGQTLTRPGDQVTGPIKCKLSNRVSSETSEAVHQTCYNPSQQCDCYVATGGNATLPMTFALDQSDKLTWMHGRKTILRQTKDKFTSEGKNIIVTNNSTIVIVTANGSLTWANVAQSNAGAYKAEVHDRDGKSRWASKSTRLCVIDPVPKPTVTHECNQTEVKLTCDVQTKAEGFDFEWLQNNQVLDTEKGQTLTRPGDQVTGPIKCKLSNRVSSETSEAVHQTCYNSSQQCDYSVARGGKATLPMTFALDQSDELTWMHGRKTILRQTKDKFTSEGKNIVTANGSLTWANVAQSNAGPYKAEVHDRDGKSRWTSKSTRLCVIDPVPKPTVTHECKQTEVKFTCKVQTKQAEGFNFEWLQDNQVLDKEKGQTLTRPGDQVTGSITCKLSNRVSSATSEAVHQTCYTPIFPDKLFGINSWIVVGTGGGVVLLLIIGVIVGCVCSKRKKRLHLEEEEERRL